MAFTILSFNHLGPSISRIYTAFEAGENKDDKDKDIADDSECSDENKDNIEAVSDSESLGN